MKIIAARLEAIRPGRSGKPDASERTVQRSIGRLKAAGYIRHERVPKPDPDDPRNLTGWRFYFNFAPVHSPVVEAPREVTKPPREVTKESLEVTPEAAILTREVTSKSGDSIVTQFRGDFNESEENVNVGANDNVTSSGGRGETRPPGPTATLQAKPSQAPAAAIELPATVDSPPAAPVPLATVAEPTPAALRSPEELLAELAKMPVRFPFLAASILWALIDQGVPLPSPWDKVKLPPRPSPEVPADPPRAVAAPPSAQGQDPPPADRRYFVPPPQQPPPPSTIEDLIRRLYGHPELAKELASRFADKWDDQGSLHGFIPKLTRAATGEIPIKAVLKAYRKASKCGPDAIPGAIFHHALNLAIGGGL